MRRGERIVERIKVFIKAQTSAFLGGLFDYLLMIFLTECFKIHYTISIAIAGVFGAFLNFSLSRHWAFHSKGRPYKSSAGWQVCKFALMVLNSIVMKATGTYLITTYFGIDYKISRIITDIIISLLVNYTIQKYWIFKKVY